MKQAFVFALQAIMRILIHRCVSNVHILALSVRVLQLFAQVAKRAITLWHPLIPVSVRLAHLKIPQPVNPVFLNAKPA